MNTMDTAESSDAPLSSALSSVAYVLFGDALPMQALRHVLKSLDLVVAEPAEALKTEKELRVVFDGRDAQACRKKAEFMRSLGSRKNPVLIFPLGKVPHISPMLEKDLGSSSHQGTIFDLEVELFCERWSGAIHSHRLSHFLLTWGVSDQVGFVTTYTAKPGAAKVLDGFQPFTSSVREEERLRTLCGVIAGFEGLLAAWHKLAVSGKTQLLESHLTTWNKMIANGQSAHPLATFRDIIRGLDGAIEFRTSVSDLWETDISTIETWKTQIDLLK